MSNPRTQEQSFTCLRCRLHVSGNAFGTKNRNHCPACLWSRHLDDQPGDRASPCRAPMEPIGIEVRKDGEWALIHRCTACHTLRANRIAGDDRELALLSLALRPIANPAFPIDALSP
jgi:hypothetical protein